MHEIIKEYEIINKKKNKTKTEIDKIERERFYSFQIEMLEAYPIFFSALIINILFLSFDIGITIESKLIYLLFIALISNPVIYYLCKDTKHQKNYEGYFLSFLCGIFPFATIVSFPFVIAKGIIDILDWKKAGGLKRTKYKSIKESNKKYDSLLKAYKKTRRKRKLSCYDNKRE